MMKKILITFVFSALIVLPSLAFAQDQSAQTATAPTTASAPASGSGFFSSIGSGISSGWNSFTSWISNNTSNTSPSATPASNSSFNTNSGISGLLGLLASWLKLILPVLISLAIVWFAWNVFRYAVVDTDAEKTVAKLQLLWGIVAIFVMVSIWGLVAILQVTFFANGNLAGSQSYINGITQPFQNLK